MKNKIICLFLVLVFCFYTTCFASENSSIYVWSQNQNSIKNETVNNATSNNDNNITNQNNNNINDKNNSILKHIEKEVSTELTEDTAAEIAEANTLNLESGSAILIEQTTGQIVYAHNIHEKLRPASVTKIMSILLIMEQIEKGAISLQDQVPCSETAAAMGGSQIWLDTTETLSVEEMLKSICVVSANDCVVAMSEYIAGSESAFVQMMNDKAKELGMNDTCFKNCHGIDEDGHVSSSYDIALMSKELLNKYPEVTKYTTIWMDTLRDGKSELVNTNKLIKTYEGATGLKTGSTSLALYNLSASATRNNLSLIAVIMKAPSTKVRFAEAQKLLDYGFNTYSFTEFGKKDDIIVSANINKGSSTSVDLKLENTCGVMVKKGESTNVEQVIEIDNKINAPISQNQILGTVKYVLDGEVLSSCNLIAANDVDKTNFFSMSKRVFYNWINVLRGE